MAAFCRQFLQTKEWIGGRQKRRKSAAVGSEITFARGGCIVARKAQLDVNVSCRSVSVRN